MCLHQALTLKTADGKKILRYRSAAFHINLQYFSNAALLKGGFKPPTTTKTGTTIVGIIYKDGVILGADTRATEGPIVSDKNCAKIHYLADNI